MAEVHGRHGGARVGRAHSRATTGALLVAAGAALWASDVLLRKGLASTLPAVEVVFWEHALLAALTLPLLLGARAALAQLGTRDWLALAVVGGGASVTATILFTQALALGDPTLPLLLQKLQPLIAIAGARALLGERPSRGLALYLLPALAGSYLITFADPLHLSAERALPALLSLGAAALWASGTVLGKRLAVPLAPAQLTAARFAVGLPVAALALLVVPHGGARVAASLDDAPALIGLALIPGLLALYLYYRGLARTKAAVATLAELAFPLTALVLGVLVLGSSLSHTQMLGASVLAATVVALTVADRAARAPVR